MAKGESNLALTMAVDVLAVDRHLGAMANDPLDHGGNLEDDGDLSWECMRDDFRSTCQ